MDTKELIAPLRRYQDNLDAVGMKKDACFIGAVADELERLAAIVERQKWEIGKMTLARQQDATGR